MRRSFCKRRGILVHLIALEQDLRALLQLCIALFEDAVIFVDNDRHIDRNDVHAEALHQFALVEITEQNGFGRRPTCAMRIPRKFLIIQATRTNLSRPSAKIGSLTRQFSI